MRHGRRSFEVLGRWCKYRFHREMQNGTRKCFVRWEINLDDMARLPANTAHDAEQQETGETGTSLAHDVEVGLGPLELIHLRTEASLRHVPRLRLLQRVISSCVAAADTCSRTAAMRPLWASSALRIRTSRRPTTIRAPITVGCEVR